MSDWAIRKIQESSSAFIQWKGTDVCMDCYCVCGESFHFDADFAYAVQCPVCERRYEMSAVVEMREMKPGEIWDGCEIVVGRE
jgi:hypothetical protein